MSTTLQIENADATVKVFLHNQNPGLSLIKNTWQTQIVGNRAIETMELMAIHTTETNLIALIVSTEEQLDLAVKYHDSRRETDARWFVNHHNGEEYKRSLIYNYILEQTSRIDRLNTSYRATFRLAITRDVAYEEYATVDSAVGAAIDCFGGKWNLSSGDQNNGTFPGRITQLEVPGNGSSGLGYKKIWVGIKEDTPTPANFVPRIEIEDASLLTGSDASVAAEATAYDNSMVEVSFATNASMKFRTSNSIGSNWRDYVGQYLVLLRCKKSSTGSEMLVRLSTSWVAPSNSVEVPVDRKAEQEVPDSTDWQILEVGEIEIPPASLPYIVSGSFGMDAFKLNLEAERISGTGSLHLDALCLIPSNRYTIFGSNNTGFSDYIHRLVITDKQEAEAIFYADAGGDIIDHMKPTAFNWSWPVAGGILVFAATQKTLHREADNMQPSLSIMRRWKTKRQAI